MRTRLASRLQTPISEIGLGCWQLGSADWGPVNESTALDILQSSINAGITFIDTADVYGSGRSESTIGKFLKTLPAPTASKLFIASKLGRLKGFPDSYTLQLLRDCTKASVDRLGRPIDLHQLHCIPHAVLKRGEIFDWLRTLKAEGLIKHFGVSVESMEEALTCLRHPDVDALQIIFNIFRQKPIDELFGLARQKGVALIIRLPLASGLLAGTYSASTAFPQSDHRNYNKDGTAFNVGETFAGIPFNTAVQLTSKLKPLLGISPHGSATPTGIPMAHLALRWILDHPAVTTVIPGASKPSQAVSNPIPSSLPPLSKQMHDNLRQFYESQVKQHIRGPY